MSPTVSRIAWTLTIGVTVGLCLLVAPWGQAQQDKAAKAKSPQEILSQHAVAYVSWDGEEAHRAAFEQTAAYKSLYESGVMATIDKVGKAISDMAQQQGQEGPDQAEMQALEVGMQHVMAKGFSAAVSLSADDQGPPLPHVVVVLHEAGHMTPGLTALVRKLGEKEGIELQENDISGRQVASTIIPGTPGVEIGWWTEGSHMVIAAGISSIRATIDVAEGTTPNITASAAWKKYGAEKPDYERAMLGWFDFGLLRNKFGEFPLQPVNPENPPTINQVLKALGLDQLGAIVTQSGFKGPATWTETTVEAPAPRTGLLSLADQRALTMKDLPPLPFSTSGFHACSVDWTKLYQTHLKVIRDVAALLPEDTAAQINGMVDNIPAIVQFDPEKDLFEPLGDVVCVYGDPRNSVFGLGMGLAISVDDPDTLKRTLKDVLGSIIEQNRPEEVRLRTTEKHGRELVTLEMGGGAFNPTYAVDDKWLCIGLLPQSAEALLLRLDGKLTNWQPSRTWREGLDAMPGEFTSITGTDPRKSYRFLMGVAPLLLSAVQTGVNQSGLLGQDADLSLSVADLPPAELVARSLFPNLSTCEVNDEGLHWQTRTSLPGIPFLGGGDGGSSMVAIAGLTAVLLPAVQQARTAARRSQSRNNLKQLGLAMHNYHDVHSAFPRGTADVADLKPEERTNWLVELLPYMDQPALYEQFDREKAWDAEENDLWSKTEVPILRHPASKTRKTKDGYPTTDYVGIAGVGAEALTAPNAIKGAGIFGYNRQTRLRDVTDGLSNTMMISEASGNKGAWSRGGTGSLRALTKKPYVNGPDGLGGPTADGFNVGFGDGSVRFLSKDIDPKVLEALATMAGGEVVGDY